MISSNEGLIGGISHLTFVVKDLQRAFAFFRDVLDAVPVYSSGDDTFSLAPEMFLMVGGVWICIMQGETQAIATYDHVAFQVEESHLDAYAERIRNAGGTLKPERPRIDGEGRSVYFYDLDNHLFELHSGTLPERLAAYASHLAQP